MAGRFRTFRQKLVPLTLRIPEEVRAGLESAALRNRNSLNSEVIRRLEISLAIDTAIPNDAARIVVRFKGLRN